MKLVATWSMSAAAAAADFNDNLSTDDNRPP
jgi:hypothetical protein